MTHAVSLHRGRAKVRARAVAKDLRGRRALQAVVSRGAPLPKIRLSPSGHAIPRGAIEGSGHRLDNPSIESMSKKSFASIRLPIPPSNFDPFVARTCSSVVVIAVIVVAVIVVIVIIVFVIVLVLVFDLLVMSCAMLQATIQASVVFASRRTTFFPNGEEQELDCADLKKEDEEALLGAA